MTDNDKKAASEDAEHLKQNRQVILVRSVLIGAASALPLPGIGELLAMALSRGLVYHVARLRYCDIEDEAVSILLAPPEKQARFDLLSAVGGLLSLLRKRPRLRRLFTGLAVLNGLEAASRAFHMATLLDHYCAQHHHGAAMDAAEARRLRTTMDQAASAAQRAVGGALLEQLVTQGLRLMQAVPTWIWARVKHTDALPPLPALLALVNEARSFLGQISVQRYFGLVVENFDQKWGVLDSRPS